MTAAPPVLCPICKRMAELIGEGSTYGRYQCRECIHTWDTPAGVSVPSISRPRPPAAPGVVPPVATVVPDLPPASVPVLPVGCRILQPAPPPEAAYPCPRCGSFNVKVAHNGRVDAHDCHACNFGWTMPVLAE